MIVCASALLALTCPPVAPLPAEEVPSHWQALADCESGDRNHGTPVEDTARWWWGDPDREHPPWGTDLHHGGLQFAPQTWDAFRSPHHPERAYQASAAVQVDVARKVRDAQGWGAWPVCSRKVGLR